jgi:DNA invertase Pin-like site-specific DNA recombinase
MNIQNIDERSVAVYARVSTGNQGTGLEAQIRALRNYCNKNGISSYQLFQDENQSGVKASRPALDKMMKEVREGKISKVIVYSFSRYARSVTHLLNALSEFKSLDVSFISISENIDTDSPLGSAIFAILGAVSQLERDILVERVKVGLANAKAKGVKLGRKKTRDSSLIRKLYKSGMTYKQISQASGASNGSIAAEIREYKRELKEKEELDKTLREREYKSIKDELEKTRIKVANLTQKIPESEREKFKDKILGEVGPLVP